MRAKAVMLGLVLGVAGWLGTASTADAAPMVPAKDALINAPAVVHVGNRAARAHKARAPRATMRKTSRTAAHRSHKTAERAKLARKGHLQRFARHTAPKTAEVHKREHSKKVDHPINPQTHYTRQVGDWSRHHSSHETNKAKRQHHAHKDHGKDAWKDHFRRKKDKDGKDGEDGKKTKVTHLGSIDHKGSHDGNDDNDNEYDNGHHNRGDRYYSGRGVYVDDNNNNDEEDNEEREEKKAENTTYRDCEKGRDCEVKMKWIRVPVTEEKEEEVPLK